MLIAEELDADWSKVLVEQLPYGLVASPEAPGVAPKYGPQFAGGSTSVSDGWADLRQAGARARAMLVRAAADEWRTDPLRLSTRDGMVLHADGRKLPYGAIAGRAARLTPPAADVPLKKPAEYRIIGRPTRTIDAEEIVTGRARYGLDATLPGALVAVVERCPYFSGGLKSYDASATRAVPGVRDVVVLPGPAPGDPIAANLATSVAVIADDTWSALKGRRALKVEWTRGPHGAESSASLDAQCEALLAGQGRRVREDGDFDRARIDAARVVEARYRVPYVSHCPLEPQNACAHVQADRVTIVAPMQSPGGASRVANQLTGIDRLKIDVTMTRVGGGFGRRLTNDFVAEAVLLSRLTGKPIKVVWTREDDLRHDFYRPFGHHHMIATLDESGRVTGWAHRLASASKYHRRPDVKPEEMWTPEIYTDDFPARCVPNLRYEWLAVDSGMTRGSWRAPAHTANAFVVESFLDEIAHASGQDPLTLRLALLGPSRELPYEQHGGPTFNPGRLAEVLKRAAGAIGWGRPVARGRGLGLAAHFTFGGYAAHALEVSTDGNGGFQIERCICAVDIGRAINPLGAEAQMMGGTIDGISTAMNAAIAIEGGRVTTANFNDYPLLTSAEAPDVEVHFVDNGFPPGGAGEMGTPTAAPALANAIFAASGRRLRDAPFRPQLARAT
jgi:isoquinoline 1-oxidoreductase beta subunit